MGDHSDLPFKAEYAKSGRASCKSCRDSIAKDSLRLAIMVQSPMFDGKIPNWFHHKCFWKRAKVTDAISEIHGFDSLRWEDQQNIKEKVQGGGGGGGGDAGSSSSSLSNYTTEYAKSNRSTCRGCESKIEKDDIRISKKDYETERAKMYGPQDLWHHVDCFVKKREELEFGYDLNVKKITGFSKLKKEDQDELVSKLGKGEKRKGEQSKASNKKQKKEETEEEKALRVCLSDSDYKGTLITEDEQSKVLWTFRDNLQKQVSNNALKGLLEYNKQKLPSGESKLLDLVSDCMAFGALKPCEECKEGQLFYSIDGYKCSGNITSWTKCMNITKTPKRKPFKVPTEYHDVQFLKAYKYVKRERVFPAVSAPVTASLSSSLDSVDGASGSSNKPLSGMRFVFIGKAFKNKAELSKAITNLGGKVVTKVDKKVTACISTKEEVDKMKKDMQAAKAADVHVVDEKFVDAVKNGGAVLLIQAHSIASWGSDPLDRIEVVPEKPVMKSGRVEKDSIYTKSMPKTMKMTVKGGAAVDPESGLEGQAHVMEHNGEILNAVLGLVDLVRGTNSYYKIQVLESDKGNRYWVFRAWGRVGTTIGGNKLESCGGSGGVAKEKFMELYAEKTGNEWADKKNFTKYPNKFYPLDIDYGGEEEEVKKLGASAGGNSKLPPNVQDIVKMIFDVESMKKAMLEFEIDLKKMPLGKLSKKQIQEAYKVLTELTELIDGGGSQTRLLDASNRFYTLIPHDFGMKKPPLLDNKDVVKSKTEMLENLLDIEVAYGLLKSGDDGEKDPIDVHYEKLKTDMKVLDKKSDEHKRLVEYVKNTHATTHNYYDLEVDYILKIDREGEKKRYKPFRALDNRMLLWHGSRTTNYAGILSQGLRIAPPEAPVTGYMFGKGVYFADMVSKSANYCRTSKNDPNGLMLLCEVALGNMYELRGAEYVSALPKGKHSTKGIGMTTPDPKGFYTEADGSIIPMGKGTDAGIGHSSLLYNEYIVYDVSQVHMKYIFKMKFNFKY